MTKRKLRKMEVLGCGRCVQVKFGARFSANIFVHHEHQKYGKVLKLGLSSMQDDLAIVND